jgi:hypothetical protein
MKGIIVLDGPDGSGKTTLANYLKEHHGARVLHLTYRWKDRMPLYHYAAIKWAIKHSQNQLVVLDRWWMSEVCYANAYRGGSKWPTMGRGLDRVLLKHAGLYVYCLPENPRDHLNAYEALKMTRDELFDDITPAVIEYHKLWDKVKTWPHVVRYDYQTQGKDLPTFVDGVFAKLAELQADQWPEALTLSKDYLGNLGTAKYLVVSEDALKPREYPMWGTTAVPTHVTNTFERFGFNEYDFFWVRTVEQAKAIVDGFDIQPICFGSPIWDKYIKQFIKPTGRDLYYLKRAGQPIYIHDPKHCWNNCKGAQFPTNLIHMLTFHELFMGGAK